MDLSAKWDLTILINELIQGKDQASQLKLHLVSSDSDSDSDSIQVQDLLLQRVLSSFENALLMLQWSTISATHYSTPLPPDSGSVVVESSSVSMNNGGATPSENSNHLFMDNQSLTSGSLKKRKTIHTWTEQVKVNAEHGLEGPADDGYSWRKYGQKDILGAKYPRSYYRCTYRLISNCCATKQVQRSDDHPTVFDITYKGFHTCNQTTVATNSAAPPPENKDQPKQMNVNINHQTAELLMNFQTKLFGSNTEETNNNWVFGENQFEQIPTIADESHLGKNSGSLFLPIIPESNYFSASSWNDNLKTDTTLLRKYESELTDIISSDASATSLQFSVDTVDFDPNFFGDISDFLSLI